ncbi:site-specific integrase [Flagellimonas meridianipacifica]|uniref:Site-specific recombinase XerD n=1 Tax=Flagellimonas meridianipacifica TaxID=1080225 RepID=A0A2T0MFE9_9FLAO|nr:site-specific integrase [Allomuricauda pacifica]PRX56284.1 site-specific recombinase XerD [Allomuricauda pacifica]
MSSVQVVLRKKPNKQNKYPIAIRITKNRKASYLFIGQYIDEKYWDEKNKRVKKSHPNSIMLNSLILNKLSEANNSMIAIEIQNGHSTASNIKQDIIGTDKLDFFEVAKLHLENLKNADKLRQYQTQKGRVSKFMSFVGKEKLYFEEITVFLLKNFESFILHQELRRPRTAANYMILIRKIFNLAISESIVERKHYPFGKSKIQIRIPESEKIGLSKEEVKILENAKGLTDAQQAALNVWLISFYFAGIRVSDVLLLKWSDFKDGRLLYRMNKNQKLVSLKIPLKAQVILDSYKHDSKSDLVFPYLYGTDLSDKRELLVRTRTVTRTLNRRLQLVALTVGIDKRLSMHIARHTFGNISGDKIPIQMLQKLYRHSSITTTVAYQASFMKKDADEALDKVVNF